MVFKKRTDKSFSKKLLKFSLGSSTIAKVKKGLTERELIALESKIGKQLFGPLPKGHNREFFCLDERTWIWHEEWMESGKIRERTTRYEIQPKRIIKIQDGQPYQEVTGEELYNLVLAARTYLIRISKEVYDSPISEQKPNSHSQQVVG